MGPPGVGDVPSKPAKRSTEIYEGLVPEVYDAAVDASLWDGVVEKMRVALRCSTFALFFQDGANAFFSAAASLDPAGIAAFETHYAAINPWAPAFLAKPAGEIVVGNEILDPAELRRTEFYNDWMRPNGLGDGIGLILSRRTGGVLIFSGLRAGDAGDFSVSERRLLARLVPHVQRATDISLRLDHAARVENGFSAGLDALAVGVFLVDAECRLLFANAFGDHLLRQGGGLVARAGRLAAETPQATARLTARIRAVANTSASAGGVVPLPRSDGQRQAALVCPASGPMRLGMPRATAMLFVSAPEAELAIDARELAALFDLTAAEADLLAALASGARLADYAERAGITVNTSKDRLRNVLAKTGSKRQADLVRLVLSNPLLRRRS